MMNTQDSSEASSLWDVVARLLEGRMDGSWTLSLTDSPDVALFTREKGGSISCHFSPSVGDIPGQGSARRYLGRQEMAILKEYFARNPKIELPGEASGVYLTSTDEPSLAACSEQIPSGWDGNGMLFALAEVVSPPGPDLFSRIGPWYVDSLEAIWKCHSAAMERHVELEKNRLEVISQSAESGDAEAQYRLGVELFWRGGKDKRKGLEWIEKSAGAGFADAQYALGCIQSQDYETGGNLELAAEWWVKAAGQSHPDAAWQLHLHYVDDGDNPRYADSEKSLFWLKRAAELGHLEAKRLAGGGAGRGC